MSDRLESSRRRFERSVTEFGEAVEGEFGWMPKLSGWIVPLVAASVGIALGIAFRRQLPRLRGRR